MKTQLTIFALLLQLHSFSQVSYTRYLNHSVKWTRTFSAPYHFETHNYYIYGDTMLASKWYYKVRDNYHVSDSYSGTLQDFWGNVYSMALREDSLKCFWVRYVNDTAEHLRYNFNRPPNDSLLGSAIISIDTIYFDGEPRQCFHNETYNVLIEGIGIPDTRTYFTSLADIMHCFFKDTAMYSYDGNCYLLSSVDEAEKIDFTIYPNPASGLVNVEAEENISAFTLSDLTGRAVITKTHNEKKFPLDVSALPRGVYFLSVKSGIKQGVKKFVLQ